MREHRFIFSIAYFSVTFSFLGSILEETSGDSYLQSNLLQLQHDSLIKMEAGGAGTSSQAMSPPSSSVGGNYFNLNSLIATPTSNQGSVHNAQASSPISSSIILATSAQNHGIHGNLLFDSVAGGSNSQCPNSPTILTPSSTILHTTASTAHHLTHLGTPPEHHHHHAAAAAAAYQSHHHHLHYHHSLHHHHHHIGAHHAHLATPPQGSLIMATTGPQSPGSGGGMLGPHGDGQFHQQNYLTAKMESPGPIETLNQADQNRHISGQTDGQQQQQQEGTSMMLGNSYSM